MTLLCFGQSNAQTTDQNFTGLFLYEPTHTKSAYHRLLNVEVSDIFFNCADSQLRKDFEQNTGLKINHQTSVTIPQDVQNFNLKTDTISSFGVSIFVNYNWNQVKIKWKSRSGRVYKLSDEDIDCKDIVFWFEGLDPVLYHQQLFPKVELPFTFNKLKFEVKIERLTIDLLLEIHLDNSSDAKKELIISDLDKLISKWNARTEREDTKKEKRGEEWYESKGVIHNWKIIKNIGSLLSIQFDMGSADIFVLKKMIELLNKKHGSAIARIVIG